MNTGVIKLISRLGEGDKLSPPNNHDRSYVDKNLFKKIFSNIHNSLSEKRKKKQIPSF